MFFHSLKNALKTTLKNNITLIWVLLFPIALGTFMYMAFGNLFEDEMFTDIPVAVVTNEENEALTQTLKELDKEGDDKVISATWTSREEASKMLNDEEVTAIIYVGKTPSLEVLTNSYEATVLKVILEEYEKANKVIEDIGKENPLAVMEAVANITSEVRHYTAKTTSEGNQDVYTNFFYAVFAMSCLFAALVANDKIHNIQANASALGMRRCLAPMSKMITVVSEFVAMITVQFVIEVISLLYFTALGVDFGDHYFLIMIVLFFGSCIGTAIGILVGAAVKSKGSAEGICVSIGLGLSVMADLMVGGIKYSIEEKLPLLNRINPAVLIVDSFYALNIYDTYDRYIRNVATLGIMSVVLIAISVIILRRNKYASL